MDPGPAHGVCNERSGVGSGWVWAWVATDWSKFLSSGVEDTTLPRKRNLAG